MKIHIDENTDNNVINGIFTTSIQYVYCFLYINRDRVIIGLGKELHDGWSSQMVQFETFNVG